MKKLKTCPFCAGDVIFFKTGFGEAYSFICRGCGAIVTFPNTPGGTASAEKYNQRACDEEVSHFKTKIKHLEKELANAHKMQSAEDELLGETT